MSDLRNYYTNLTETTGNGGGLSGGAGSSGGVSTAEVQAAIAAQATAQQAVDDAQDAVAAAEELDDDAQNAAQDLLIAAQQQLSDANAMLAAANEAAIADLPTSQDLADAVANVETQQAAVDAAQDAAALAEEADDDTVDMAQDALITANKNLADANALLAAANAALAHDPAPQDLRIGALEDILGTITRFEILQATPGDTTLVFNWNTATNLAFNANSFYITDDPDSNTPLTEVTVGPGQTTTLYMVANLENSNNVGGLEFTVTNNSGVLSYAWVAQKFEPENNGETAYVNYTYNQLTESNANVGALSQAMGDHVFTPDASSVPDLSKIHDAAPQDERITALENASPSTYDDTAITAAAQAAQDTADGNGEEIALLITAVQDGATIRDNADNALDTRVTAVEALLPDDDSTLVQAIADNAAAIAAEIGDTDADVTTLLGQTAANLTATQTNQAAAVANATNLTQEAQDRAAADTTLQTNIDLEASARESADTAEANDRVSGDNALNVRLTAVESMLPVDTSSLAADILANTNSILAEMADQDTLEGQVTTLTATVGANTSAANAAAAAATTAATAAATAQSDADNAQSDADANATAINDEATARANADTTLQSNIDSEATTRADADTALQTALDAEIVETNTEQDAQDVLLAKLLDRIKTDQSGEITTTANAGALTAANNAVDTGNFNPAHAGEYIIEASGLWGYNNSTTDIFIDLVEELNGATIVKQRLRQEPKDTAGTGAGGTDQRHNFKIREVVTLAPADNARYFVRFFSGTNGVLSVVDSVLLTINWWSD